MRRSRAMDETFRLMDRAEAIARGFAATLTEEPWKLYVTVSESPLGRLAVIIDGTRTRCPLGHWLVTTYVSYEFSGVDDDTLVRVVQTIYRTFRELGLDVWEAHQIR